MKSDQLKRWSETMYKDATSVSYRNGIVLRRRLEKESPETYEDGSNEVDVGIPNYKYRTHNRNRSLSFINSDQQVNVNKGSRQIKPVTLGKRLALMIGYLGRLVLMSTTG